MVDSVQALLEEQRSARYGVSLVIHQGGWPMKRFFLALLFVFGGAVSMFTGHARASDPSPDQENAAQALREEMLRREPFEVNGSDFYWRGSFQPRAGWRAGRAVPADLFGHFTDGAAIFAPPRLMIPDRTAITGFRVQPMFTIIQRYWEPP